MDATQDVVAIICIYVQLTARVIANMRRCKIIARPGVGYDMVDVAAAKAHGIMVTNVPDYGPDEVADHAVALLLARKRRIVAHDRNIRSGKLDYKLVGPSIACAFRPWASPALAASAGAWLPR